MSAQDIERHMNEQIAKIEALPEGSWVVMELKAHPEVHLDLKQYEHRRDADEYARAVNGQVLPTGGRFVQLTHMRDQAEERLCEAAVAYADDRSDENRAALMMASADRENFKHLR